MCEKQIAEKAEKNIKQTRNIHAFNIDFNIIIVYSK